MDRGRLALDTERGPLPSQPGTRHASRSLRGPRASLQGPGKTAPYDVAVVISLKHTPSVANCDISHVL